MSMILTREQVIASINDLYTNGLPQGEGIGIQPLDDLIRWELGRLSVITGIPGHGKSEFIDFLNVQLNQRKGWKAGYFSPEKFPIGYHIQSLVSKITNKRFDTGNTTKEELDQAVCHIANNFFFMDCERVVTVDDIIAATKELITRENIKMLVIDPFNCIEHQQQGNATETENISKILDKFTSLARTYNILIHLVAHPHKMPQRKDSEACIVPTPYTINGSANFYNKADYCTTIYREANDQVKIYVQKVRFKNLGMVGSCTLNYDYFSGNYSAAENSADPLATLLSSPPEDDDLFRPTKEEQEKHEREKALKEALREAKEAHAAREKNVLDVEVSLFNNVRDTTPKPANLYEFLTTKRADIDLEELRKKTDFKDLKRRLPCVTPSGIFKENRSIDALDKHSGLLCIDVDGKDNTLSMDSIFNTLKGFGYIAYVGRSCSGSGLFAIIPIANPKEHKAHFAAIEEDLLKLNIVVDSACKDVCRLRLYSYDYNAYLNPKAAPYTNLKMTHQPSSKSKNVEVEKKNAPMKKVSLDDSKLKRVLADIAANKVDITNGYSVWFKIGCALWNSFGEEGRQLFHLVSQHHPEYNEDETNVQYDGCRKGEQENKCTIGTVYYYYHQAKKNVCEKI